MNHAPIRNADPSTKPWEGDCKKKPWEYTVTAVIPVLDTPEMLGLAVELLRLQTERPFILIIDTGSSPENLQTIQAMRAEDVEVHSLLLNGVTHPSDFPCFAQDLAHAICRTEYLFCTHADVFLTKRNVIEEFLGICRAGNPVVGYEISPRPHTDWVGMVGHTCMMYHVPTADNLGITWSQRRLCAYYGVPWRPSVERQNWPDTEVGFNVLWREAGISPKIMGTEQNYIRNQTPHFDHCRSATGAKLYNPNHWKKCQEWLADAQEQAQSRIKQWKLQDYGQQHLG